ncbi:hypothetical protein IX51_09060 [uncultured archaeon]|nr:hypothetical protein IX51_09060 [uncultured archaeon]
MVDLSVEIPTYNEAENIGKLIDELERLPIDLEIIVIDDSSPDGTSQVVEDLKDKYSNLKLVVRPSKKGLASAILEGMQVAESDNIAVMDGDMQHPPDLLEEMLTRIRNGNDLVIASRYTSGGNPGKLSLTRKLISKSATLMAHVMLRETKIVKDPLSGYFVFRKDVVNGANISPTGYKILLEVLMKGHANKMEEIPYTFRPRFMGSSKLSIWEDLNYIHLILKLAEYRPLKFVIVGVTGVIINVGILGLLHTLGISIPIAGAVSIESSILSNFAVNNAWTFRNKKDGGLISRLLKYNLVTLLGAVINYAALNALVLLSVHYIFADLIGIALGFLANYLGSELFVWSPMGSKKKHEN